MYELFLLNSRETANFEKYTYPAIRCLLRFESPIPLIIAVGVEKNDEPIGLGLMLVNGNKAYILSLCIDPQPRDLGLWLRLLATLEAEIIKRKVRHVEFVYVLDHNTKKLERILKLRYWSRPRLQKLKDLSPYVVFSCRLKKTFKNF